MWYVTDYVPTRGLIDLLRLYTGLKTIAIRRDRHGLCGCVVHRGNVVRLAPLLKVFLELEKPQVTFQCARSQISHPLERVKRKCEDAIKEVVQNFAPDTGDPQSRIKSQFRLSN